MNRRSLIGGLAVILAAPAVIRTPGLLMQVRPRRMFTVADFELMMRPQFARWIADDRDRLRSLYDTYLVRLPEASVWSGLCYNA